MTTKSIIKKLNNAIIEQENQELINSFREELIKNITEVYKDPLFYSLPIDQITKIINQVDFSNEEEVKEPFLILRTVISKTCEYHEKESIQLLNDIKVDKLPPLRIDDIINLVSNFSKSELLRKLYELNVEEQSLVSPDYEYITNKLEEENRKLKEEICKLKEEICKHNEENNKLRKRLETIKNQLYVRDLPLNADREFLNDFFSEAGNIIALSLKRHPRKPKLSAFITFDTHEAAEKAFNEINYTKLDGFPIRISWADAETMRLIHSDKGKLIIKGLEKSIEVSQLHETFSNFGEVITSKIPLDKDPVTGEFKSRGYGFVQFRNEADAELVKADLAGASINGQKIIVENYVKRPKPTQ